MRATKQRRVLITLDTILELFKDYCNPEDIPSDSVAIKLLFKPTEVGKLAMIVTSDSYAAGASPLNIHFDIRRIHSV